MERNPPGVAKAKVKEKENGARREAKMKKLPMMMRMTSNGDLREVRNPRPVTSPPRVESLPKRRPSKRAKAKKEDSRDLRMTPRRMVTSPISRERKVARRERRAIKVKSPSSRRKKPPPSKRM